MQNKQLYFLALITLLTSFTVDKKTESMPFETKVNAFINEFKTSFEVSSERFLNSNYNDINLEKKAVSSWNKTLTLKSNETFKNHYNQTVKQRLYFGFHEYETIEACSNAFNILLDCLGTDCQKIKWGDDNIGLKTTPFIYLKTKKQIIFCKIKCEHKNDSWEDIKERIEETFKTDNYKIISADCGGPLTYKSVEN